MSISHKNGAWLLTLFAGLLLGAVFLSDRQMLPAAHWGKLFAAFLLYVLAIHVGAALETQNACADHSVAGRHGGAFSTTDRRFGLGSWIVAMIALGLIIHGKWSSVVPALRNETIAIYAIVCATVACASIAGKRSPQ
ncbi:MAG: hypothetical protein ABJC74_13370 [Gemmatimonadota bacterium]